MQTITDPLNERSTPSILIPLLGDDGAPLSDGLVTAITVTTRDLIGNTKIRDGQSVLNENGGTLSGGTLALVLSQDDTQAIGSVAIQPRVLTLDVRASGGLRITEEVAYSVRVMADIT